MSAAETMMHDVKVRTMIEHLTAVRGDLFAVQDRAFRYTEFNQGYAEVFKQVWGIQLTPGTSMFEALAAWPEELEKARALWARALAGETFEIEETFGQGDEQQRTYRLYFQPILDNDGNCSGASHIIREVTEENEIRLELEKTSSRFQVMADNIAQLAWMTAPDGNIYWYNQRWYDYTGLDFAETRGMKWKCVHHPDHVDRVVAHFKKSIETSDTWEDTFPLRRHDGEYRWFLSRAVPIRDHNGKISTWFGTNTDITDRRLIEQRLREAHRRKDEYLAALGHELRNPLAAIRSASEIISLAEHQDPNVQRAGEVLQRQVNQAVELINGLLEVSRLAMGKIQVRCEDHDLAQLCREVLEDRAPVFAERGLKLEYGVPSAPVWARLDRVRATQVLDNVLTNALKFTPAPGTVTVAVHAGQHEIRLDVSDTGVGLDPSSLSAIFEPLHQNSDDRHLSSGGLGLGLALSKALMELQGGRIEADSPGRGQGTRFSIVFTPGSPRADRHERTRRTSKQQRRILLVEDNPDAAEMLTILLGLLGHQVEVVESAAQALASLREDTFDIVISDIGLPDVSGYQLAATIRSDERHASLPLIALSGYCQDSDRERSKKAGFNQHLVKPVSRERLAEVLDNPLAEQ